MKENKEEQYKENHKGKTIACLCSDCIEYAKHLFDTAHSTPQTPEWASEFREYFDKHLKPKRTTMENLDRELLVDFISKQISQAEKVGYRKGFDSRQGEVDFLRHETYGEEIEKPLKT